MRQRTGYVTIILCQNRALQFMLSLLAWQNAFLLSTTQQGDATYSWVFQVHCTLTFFFTVGTTASEECFLTQLCRHPGCSSDQDAADRSAFLVLSLPWPWTVPPNIIYAALKVVVMAKSIWKLVTDSFLVSKMQPAASAMGPAHNKPRPDVSIVVSRMLSFSPRPYEKVQAFCLPADHWQ